MGILNFKKPVGAEILRGGEFHAKRDNGLHYGYDYEAGYGTDVNASESGKVVRASFNPGEGNYGFVVVIDHTPDALDSERHIYTLYGHLSVIHVNIGDTVSKGEVLGKVGNTGTKEFYANKDTHHHLHFEVIDSPGMMDWNAEGGMGYKGSVNRENPNEYLNKDKNVGGTYNDHPISEYNEQPIDEQRVENALDKFIDEKVDFVLDDDLRMMVLVDGKEAGYLDGEDLVIEASIEVQVEEGQG